MYTYRHKITGAELTSLTPCTGDLWEPVNVAPKEEPKPEKKKSVKPRRKTKK